MLTFLFPIVFAAVFVFFLVQAFRMMTLGFNMNGAASLSRRQDRTGLLTTHPELLDQNGGKNDWEKECQHRIIPPAWPQAHRLVELTRKRHLLSELP